MFIHLLFNMQIHKVTSHARRNLTSRRIRTEDYVNEELPGGLWQEINTLDVRKVIRPSFHLI